VTLSGQLDGSAAKGISEFQFSDGTSLTLQQIKDAFSAQGSSVSPVVFGSASANDTFSAGSAQMSFLREAATTQ